MINTFNPQIHYLRGIASLLVVLAHYPIGIFNFLHGAIGVDIFFILSGFVIGEVAQRYKASPNKFILNRIFRIMPLWIIACLFCFLLFSIFDPYTTQDALVNQLVASFFFVGDFKSTYSEPIIFSGWSLRYELFFYFLVYVLLLSQNIITFNINKLLILLLIALSILGLFFNSKNIHIDIIISPFYFYFAIGLLIQLNYNLITSIKNSSYTKLLFVISISILLMSMIFFDQGYSFIGNAKEELIMKSKYLALGPFPRIFIYGLPVVFFVINFLVAFKNISNRVLFFLGNISYSLYIIHSLLKPFVASNAFMHKINFEKSQIYICTIFLSIILSWLSRKYIEIEFSNWLKSKCVFL